MLSQQFLVVNYVRRVPKVAVLLTCQFEQNDGRWVAECIELGTAAYAETLNEARTELGDAIVLQVSEMDEMGYLDEFFKDHMVRPVELVSPSPSPKDRLASTWAMPQPAGL